MKIIEIINIFKKELENKNFDSPLLDCKILLSNILNIKVGDLVFYYQKQLDSEKFDKFKNMIQRRLNNEPVSKIINNKYFWDYNFYVDKNVLDPRPDSESIIELILEDYKNDEKLNILDLGSGSGCLIITLLKIFKNSNGLAIDISDKALEIVKKNAELLNIKNLDILKSNWNDEISGKFDIIISNPPYIETNEINNLSKDVKSFDPLLALDGGFDGLDCYRYIAKNIKKNCKKNTKLYFEIGKGQETDVKNIFLNKGFKLFKTGKDLAGIERVISFETNL